MAGKLKKIWGAIIGGPQQKAPVREPQAGSYAPLFSVSYNGEKNMGEIGPIKDYKLDYAALRLRSWQSYLESEISQTVLKKFKLWVIGSGLKLQADPVKVVLKSEKINLKTEAFNEMAETKFSVWAKSKISDYSGMKNLHWLANTAFVNAIIGGDVLVVLRYIKGQVKVQLIDGAHVVSPMLNNDYTMAAEKKGNLIKNGIEKSPSGEHVAYYVSKAGSYFEVERIEAKEKRTGLTMAFLIYGMEFRLDNCRGIPLIATVLETLKKLERYKEATVGSAEEVAKIAYQIVHQNYSTGENPLNKHLAKAFNADAHSDDIPTDEQGKKLADTVAVTTNKQAFNNPIGAEIKTIASNQRELYFKDFYTVNIDLVCAAIGIPPEVAMDKYDSNFSASRAALKSWEHTINVNRSQFAFQFYQTIYNLWLHTEILKNKINAPGYIKAFEDGNEIVIEAYRNARFVGATVPHIDPLKEVNAERMKLGESGKAIPLTTVEAATEALNGGDSDSNMAQYSEELKEAKKLAIIAEPPKVNPPTED